MRTLSSFLMFLGTTFAVGAFVEMLNDIRSFNTGFPAVFTAYAAGSLISSAGAWATLKKARAEEDENQPSKYDDNRI